MAQPHFAGQVAIIHATAHDFIKSTYARQYLPVFYRAYATLTPSRALMTLLRSALQRRALYEESTCAFSRRALRSRITANIPSARSAAVVSRTQ